MGSNSQATSASKNHHHHHHHRRAHHRTADDMIKLKLDHFYKSQQALAAVGGTTSAVNGQDGGAAKELCHPSCWCNNLVEITCRYPTKVVKYVSLIENNACTSHSINRSLFEKSIKLNSLQQSQNITASNNKATTLVNQMNENLKLALANAGNL